MIAWHWPELDGVEPLEIEIEPWLSEQARNEFLTRFIVSGSQPELEHLNAIGASTELT